MQAKRQDALRVDSLDSALGILQMCTANIPELDIDPPVIRKSLNFLIRGISPKTDMTSDLESQETDITATRMQVKLYRYAASSLWLYLLL
jgi:hypothetical protein